MIPTAAFLARTYSDREYSDPAGETGAALVELVAHVFSGGSIAAENYGPAVTPGKRVSAAEVRNAFERVGWRRAA